MVGEWVMGFGWVGSGDWLGGRRMYSLSAANTAHYADLLQDEMEPETCTHPLTESLQPMIDGRGWACAGWEPQEPPCVTGSCPQFPFVPFCFVLSAVRVS